MKKLTLLFTLLLSAHFATAQRSKVPSVAKEDAVSLKNYELKVNPAFQGKAASNKASATFQFQDRAFNPQFEKEYLEVYKDQNTKLPIFIKKPVQSKRSNISLPVQSIQFLESVKKELSIDTPVDEFVLIAERIHKRDNVTLKYAQVYKGLPVLDAEVIFQVQNGQVHSMSGRYFVTPVLDNVTPSISVDNAFEKAMTDVANYTKIAREDVNKQMNFICSPDKKELVIYHRGKKAILAWHLDFHPSIKERWTYVIDAQTNEILNQHKNSCSLHNHDFGSIAHTSCSHVDHDLANEITENASTNSSMVAGPFTGNGNDLLGINRTIQGYESNGTFVLSDPSRTMFNGSQSNMPSDPVGAIWTLNAMNTSPQSNNFDYDHCKNNSINWNDPVQVSGHYNSGEAYEYFANVHQRNSINSNGGNIVGFVNVSEEDGESMDNAYWNGNAMFYGNGGNAFSPLARALDVAGHELSHGVVQTTANLKYENQSGALNESFADIFGAMIDRNDWTIGEDVVNPQFFPSGALRDLQNPNNGGNSLNDAGWQPKHMNEFQNLPNTPQGDNGGVHINSGIPNHAFYRIAVNIGKSNAEDIFYKALTEYLVRSSEFIDLRIAAEKSATDLFGAGSAQLAAVQQGFDEVGIGSSSSPSTGTNTQTEIESNDGTDFILYSDPQLDNLFVAQTADLDNASQISATNQLSKPSITDDGSVIVFIGTDNRAYVIELDFIAGTLEERVLIDDPAWRNIVIAKDGSKIALVSDQALPEILVYDFASQTSIVYDLYNPTFTQGISTGDVQYADVMEFDFSGEFLMYDALSELVGSNFGEFIEYWDIGFMQVWDNQSNNFVSGGNNISKLFNQIPENTSVGNPSFAKNADFIVTFDFIDDQGDASVFATNIETGETSDQPIFTNSILNYPNYSIDDGAIIFDASSSGEQVIGTVDVNADRINATNGDAFIVIDNAKWGTWFGTAQRDLTDTYELTDAFALGAYPNPARDQVTIHFFNPTANDARLEIYNVHGQLVNSTEIDGGLQRVHHNQDIKALSNGVYLVKILIDNQYATIKLRIQR